MSFIYFKNKTLTLGSGEFSNERERIKKDGLKVVDILRRAVIETQGHSSDATYRNHRMKSYIQEERGLMVMRRHYREDLHRLDLEDFAGVFIGFGVTLFICVVIVIGLMRDSESLAYLAAGVLILAIFLVTRRVANNISLRISELQEGAYVEGVIDSAEDSDMANYTRTLRQFTHSNRQIEWWKDIALNE